MIHFIHKDTQLGNPTGEYPVSTYLKQVRYCLLAQMGKFLPRMKPPSAFELDFYTHRRTGRFSRGHRLHVKWWKCGNSE